MARPTKYSDELAKEIYSVLELGNTRKDAYTVAAISADTFAVWLRRFPEFNTKVKQAEAKARARNVGLIQKAAIEDWRAAAWWLERKDPDNWKARSQVDVLDVRKLKDQDLDTIAEIARRASQPEGD